jgi:hypothetical protein
VAEKKEPSGVRADLAAAAARLGSRLRDPGELTPATAYLRDAETVRYVVLGTHERGGGLAVLTDERLLFFLRRVTQPSLDLPLGAVDDVSTSAGLSTGEVALAVGEGTVAISRIVKGDVAPFAAAVRDAVGNAPREAARPDATGVDPFEAMEKLSALRDRGVLTEAEFAAKKQELLDRL